MITRSDSLSAFLFKYWFALLVLIPAIDTAKSIRAYPADIVLAVGFGLWGIFCLTAAEVKAHEKTLEYRRFLGWREIPYDRIQECKSSWIPGLAYLRLAQFSPPWGKVYFVILRTASSGNPKELVAFINARRAGAPVHQEAATEQEPSQQKKAVWVCVLMAFVGVAYAFLAAYLFPNLLRPMPTEGFPGWAAILIAVWNHATTWPWAIATLTLIGVAVLGLGFRNRAWILAFAFGALLGSLLIRFIG